MNHIYEKSRLISLVQYYQDTINILVETEQEKIKTLYKNYEPVFDKIKQMLNDLEAEFIPEDNQSPKKKTFKFFKNKKDEPTHKRRLCIDSIVDYVKENGLHITSFNYHDLDRKYIAYHYTSKYNLYSSTPINPVHRLLGEHDYDMFDFFVYRENDNEITIQNLNDVKNRLIRAFGHILDSGKILPDQFSLSYDEQKTLNYIHKIIGDLTTKG